MEGGSYREKFPNRLLNRIVLLKNLYLLYLYTLYEIIILI